MPYRVSILFGAGTTRTDTEMTALANLVRTAVISEAFVQSNWTPRNQPYNTYNPATYSQPVGTSKYSIQARIGSIVTLNLDRTDQYQPWPQDPVYSRPTYNPLNIAPYYVSALSRRVNGVEQLQWTTGSTEPYRTTAITPNPALNPGVNAAALKAAT